jgi:hypothetical protein
MNGKGPQTLSAFHRKRGVFQHLPTIIRIALAFFDYAFFLSLGFGIFAILFWY